jgi:tetratricopeptide (TPR) repeat protein
MTKWLMYLALALLVGGSWLLYLNTGSKMEEKQILVEELRGQGDPDGRVGELEGEIQGLEGERTFNGILLAFLSAGLVGIFFVLQILPAFAHRVTHAVYDSAEMMEHDVMHDARSLLAQGEYAAAIEAFQKGAELDPLNRLPWVEIAKIYKDNLNDPGAAIQTIRHALERQEWEVNDAAYFLFRLAELYDEVEGDRASARAIMQQVVEQFPGTRHSANANHKLHEWDAQDAAAAAAAEEEEYLQRMAAAEQNAGEYPQTEPALQEEYPAEAADPETYETHEGHEPQESHDRPV